MIGLARMAWGLAYRRVSKKNYPCGAIGPYPVSRVLMNIDPMMYPVSREYYAIIDRITRGEQP
jgi:hypothetical protein